MNRTVHRRRRRGLAAVACSAALLALATGPAEAHGGHVDLDRPGTLERGDDVRIPHLQGERVVDGDVRIAVPGAVSLLGPAGEDYVVSVASRRGPQRIERVSVDGTSRVLLRREAAQGVVLSEDGSLLVGNDYRRHATLTAYDATDGSVLATRTVREWPEVVTADADTVVVSSWQRPRTLAWDLTTGTTTKISDQVTYTADLATDRLASYTGDPYEGGCTEIATVSTPDQALWRSCGQKVLAFSPDGRRMITTGILADGIGPNEVQQRATDGELIEKYESRWFGLVEWEDADTVLLEAHSRTKGAVVRCDLDECERASSVYPANP